MYPRKFVKAQLPELSVNNREELLKKRTLDVSVKEFSIMLKTISGNQLEVSHLVMKSFLDRENNKLLSNCLMASNNYSDLLVSTMKEFVTTFLRDKKRTQEKEVIYALATTFTTHIPAHASRNKICAVLGFQTRSLYNRT